MRPGRGFSFERNSDLQLSVVKKNLSDIYMFCQTNVDDVLNYVVKKGEEKSLEKTVDVVENFCEAVFQSRPAKQKRPKHTRLSTAAGLCMTDTEYLQAINERKEQQMAKVRPKKTRKVMMFIQNMPKEPTKKNSSRFSTS